MFDMFGANAFTVVFGIMVLTSLFGMYLLNDSR
jgi:hypothetical protein